MAHRRTSFARKTPSNKSWVGLNEELITIPAGSKQLIGTFVHTNTGIDETVLRTVGQLSIRSVGDFGYFQGAFGMILVSNTAVAEGISAIPSPLFDISDDGWFIFQFCHSDEVFGPNDELNGEIYNFDSKAKRVIHDGQSIALVYESSADSNTVRLSIITRLLSMVRGT